MTFKRLAGLFAACGPNCTRNRFAGLMLGGYHAQIGASCPFQFDKDPHHGILQADTFLVYDNNGNPAWETPQRCLSP